MRVLRLGLGDGRAVDLHPAVSVVAGLTGAQRTALRRGFTAIGAGLSPAPAGLVEAHGLLLDATQDDLDLLDIAAAATSPVATVADVPAAVPVGDARRLRAADQELVSLAADRAEANQALARAEALRPPAPPAVEGRARELRARIARHEAWDPEAVRAGLDHVRDVRRADGVPDPTALVEALADVGLDIGDLGLPVPELVRMAEDWLDERGREADLVVGARVELQGIEGAAGTTAGPAPNPGDEDGLRARASAATRRQAEAVVHADELRAELVARHAPRPTAEALQEHLLARLADHRPERLAGAVPLLLDGLLAHLHDHDVSSLLDQLAAAAGPVQVVVVDEHPAASAWAEATGVQRAAVIAAVPHDGPLASA